MATQKFLPFITENSSPIHIYDSLLSRSKGVNKLTVLSIFHIILVQGIATVRQKVLENPTASEVPQVFEKLVATYHSLRIRAETLDIYLLMQYRLQDKIPKGLERFDLEDVIGFLLVTALDGRCREFTDTNFEELLNYKEIFNNLPKYVKLDDTFDKERCHVSSAGEVKRVILEKAIFQKNHEPFYFCYKANPSSEEDSNDNIPF